MTPNFTPEYLREVSYIIISVFISSELISFIFKLMYFFITNRFKKKDCKKKIVEKI